MPTFTLDYSNTAREDTEMCYHQCWVPNYTLHQISLKYFPVFCSKHIMNANLFVMMGITWTLEIVSLFVTEPRWIWYMAGAANAFQGANTFCNFVLKHKVISKLAHRLGFPNLGPITRPTTTDHPTTCYDPYRERNVSSTSTLSVASTDCRNYRRLSGSCK
jgi:hypothetical protein